MSRCPVQDWMILSRASTICFMGENGEYGDCLCTAIRSSPMFRRSKFFLWLWFEELLGFPCHLLCILPTGLVLLFEIPVFTLSFGMPSVKMAVLPTFGAWLPNIYASWQIGSNSKLESGSWGTRATPRPWDLKALSNSARLYLSSWHCYQSLIRVTALFIAQAGTLLRVEVDT